MKKQFFRVKQLADQTFLRAERSEILNYEELQVADQKVDNLRNAVTAIIKKMAPNGPMNEIDRIMRKTLEYQLGTTFVEESKQIRECHLFQYILKEAGLIEQQLARDNAEHEMKVEELVYTPLQNVLENEFPNVLKYKHSLKKYCLDKDSASNRYNATKKETVKEDLEEADSKVEQSRDLLAIEMFNILSKENEFSEYMLQLLKLQRGYHESALKNLETVIPQLERKIGNSPVRKVFGTALKEHLRVTGKRIAYPLEICITALSHYGMLEEGLFRVAGSNAKVKRLKLSIDSGCFTALIPEYRDAHILASLLKLYLRELPEPLLTYYLQKDWINAMQFQGTQKLETVKNIIEKLPQENKDNLSYLIQFLSNLSKHPENKMSASNLAIVLSPNLLWSKDEDESTNIGNCVVINMLVEYFIKEADKLFPNDVSSYANLTKLFYEEQPARYMKIIEDTKPESPRPNTRKKKSAPIPPNPIIKNDLNNILKNYDATKLDINLDNELEKVTVNTDLVQDRLSESSANSESNSRQKQLSDAHPEFALQYSQCQNLNKKDNMHSQSKQKINLPHDQDMKVNLLVTSANESNNITEPTSVCSKLPIDNIKCSTVIKKLHQSSVDDNDQLRQKNTINRTAKPEVPARPLSLTKKSDQMDLTFKLTHCSLYNVADKMHPSIINIQREMDIPVMKCDSHPVEKVFSKRQGCQIPESRSNFFTMSATKIGQNIEESATTHNIFNDFHNKTKSNEHLNIVEHIYETNSDKKGSHTRAKSDGGIMDLEVEGNSMKVVCASSKNLSKPTQPPPPPPEI